jgi:hypothetical protein
MAHKFNSSLKIDGSSGAVFAKGPVDASQGKIYWITVWVYEKNGTAAARGSSPVDPTSTEWACQTQLLDGSKKFKPGPVVGVALARVKEGGTNEYFGWWDEDPVAVKH